MSRWFGKPLIWLQDQIRSPPFSKAARVEAGYLLRRMQQGETLGLPHSRPMPVLGPRCHELRIRDQDATWRVVFRIDADAIVIAGVLRKKTRKTPPAWLESCRRRLAIYDWDREDDS